MSPTFRVSERAAREYAKLTPHDKVRFTRARVAFVEALRADPSALPPSLRGAPPWSMEPSNCAASRTSAGVADP
jgi:hypothetical protein